MIIDTKEKLDSVKESISKAEHIAFDTETNGLMFDRKMIGCSLAIENNGQLDGFYFPTAHEKGLDLFAIQPKNCPLDIVLDLLKSLLKIQINSYQNIFFYNNLKQINNYQYILKYLL